MANFDREKYVHSADQLYKELGYSRKQPFIELLKKNFSENEDWIFQPRTSQASPDMYYLTQHCLEIAVARMRPREVNKAQTIVNVANITIQYIRRFEPVGVESITFLMKSFAGILKMSPEYVVGDYRIDLYIHQHRIAVECDEDNHKRYCEEKEADRTYYIEVKLPGIRWLRFNPNEENFEMAAIVNDLCKLVFDK